MIIIAALIVAFAIWAHAAFTISRQAVLAGVLVAAIKDIKDNPALTTNAEAIEQLAARITDFIEKQFHSVR